MADKHKESPLTVTVSEQAEGTENEENKEKTAEQRDALALMAEEEAKAMARFGMAKPRQSQLLQRRISKGGKGQYFDSGDYNMSKAKGGNKSPSVLSTDHPRPENIRTKKMSAPAVMHGGPVPIPKHIRSSSGGDGGHPPSKLSPPGVTS